jgi:hypothetical protein
MTSIKDIKHEYRHLLENEEDRYLLLQKLYDWQEEYQHIPWEKFRDSYYKCDCCGGYDNQQCICYAR